MFQRTSGRDPRLRSLIALTSLDSAIASRSLPDVDHASSPFGWTVPFRRVRAFEPSPAACVPGRSVRRVIRRFIRLLRSRSRSIRWAVYEYDRYEDPAFSAGRPCIVYSVRPQSDLRRGTVQPRRRLEDLPSQINSCSKAWYLPH